MGHHHDHHHHGDSKLTLAVIINILLTIAQVIGGLVSGSLSLIADALHNLSDAGAILVAIFARKISRRPQDSLMSYGYKRAEIVGTLINSTTLILIGLYLIYEAGVKYFDPTPINGWIVLIIASIAFVIDLATAFLTYSAGAKDNMNIRAAFIHNLSDAMASLAVVAAGLLIIFFELYFVDVLATLAISIYVIYHGFLLLKRCILIIMQAVPDGISLRQVQADIESLTDVVSAKHIHIWQLDEHDICLEVHITHTPADFEQLKTEIRDLLKDKYHIDHTTIEPSVISA
ncbi:cation diffusion facilitator family transporter [Thalassotalea agarivorans]|uniref:Cobalt-zinc-cadmium efflux system protein n=1 Tax=Thalassotalea agarivorans TaxID=349064 RepID=A0A1I0AIQ3_THASX|nr:cation diffusion facilitator family transporter [Thalassotalea agarivorans]SES94177.1 cobalt-zinc-cadmium efflux system protein [Thalassotalea agarivorans]